MKRLTLIGTALLLCGLLSISLAAAQDDDINAMDRGTPTAIVWSPNSEIIAVGSTGGITLFTNHFEEIAYLTGHEYIITSLSWSPDGRYLASAELERKVRVWDVVTGETITVFQDHFTTLPSIAWNPVNNLIASGGFDGVARVWDAMTGEILGILDANTSPAISAVLSVCWASGGETIIVSASPQIFAWHIPTDEVRVILEGWFLTM